MAAKAVEKLRRERDEAVRMVGAIVYAAGGCVLVPAHSFWNADDLELVRSYNDMNMEFEFVAKRKEATPSQQEADNG